MHYKTPVIFATLCALTLLTGCVDLRVPAAAAHFEKISPAQRQLALAKIQQWKISGALSIVQQNKQPEIANYKWVQSSTQNYRITLTSALNLYRLVIDEHNGVVTLAKNGELMAAAHTPEQLMQKAVGWSLPIQPMQYWIKGMKAPHSRSVEKYDDFGHVIMLKQSGWTLHYLNYQTAPSGIDFPQLITLQRLPLSARIVVKQFGT